MSSIFFVIIFLQERSYALCSKLPEVKYLAQDRQLRDFRKLLTHLATFSDPHIELGRLFSERAWRRASVAN